LCGGKLAAADDDAGASFGQRSRHSAAKVPGRARYQRDLATQAEKFRSSRFAIHRVYDVTVIVTAHYNDKTLSPSVVASIMTDLQLWYVRHVVAK